MEYNSATKRNSLLIHAMTVMNHNYYDNWKKAKKKGICYMVLFLQNSTKSKWIYGDRRQISSCMAIDREWRKGLLLLLSRSFVSDSSDPMDCSLPGSSIHGIFQAKVLEWGAIAFSRKGLEGGITKEYSDILGGDRCVYYFDCGNSFMSVDICKSFSNYIL